MTCRATCLTPSAGRMQLWFNQTGTVHKYLSYLQKLHNHLSDRKTYFHSRPKPPDYTARSDAATLRYTAGWAHNYLVFCPPATHPKLWQHTPTQNIPSLISTGTGFGRPTTGRRGKTC